MNSKFFYVGVDLGEVNDYSAVTILEKTFEMDTRPHSYKQVGVYSVTHLERFRITYPDVVSRVKTLFRNPKLKDAVLIVDETGCGRPVADMMEKENLRPVRISITGGLEVRELEDGFHVPKQHLVSALMVLFQSGTLKIADALELAPTLVAELENFRVKVNAKTGRESFESWRENDHDDMVLSLALACWYAEQDNRTNVSLKPSPTQRAGYDPLTFRSKRGRR